MQCPMRRANDFGGGALMGTGRKDVEEEAHSSSRTGMAEPCDQFWL